MTPWADVVVPHSIAMAPATLPATFGIVQYHWLTLLCDPSAPVPYSSVLGCINSSKCLQKSIQCSHNPQMQLFILQQNQGVI